MRQIITLPQRTQILLIILLPLLLLIPLARLNHNRKLNQGLKGALERQDYAAAKYGVAQGGAVDTYNRPMNCSLSIGCGATPLQMAIIRDDEPTISFLVAKGATFNHNGSLILAARGGDVKAVRFFLRHGVDLTEKSNGFTAIDLASLNQEYEQHYNPHHEQIMKMLDEVKAPSMIFQNFMATKGH